jgi:hypothetical protein
VADIYAKRVIKRAGRADTWGWNRAYGQTPAKK